MMRKLISFLMRLGVVEGMTFRLLHEDGVGMLVVPNPTPNRVNLNTVKVPSHRPENPDASGDWTAKPLHIV